MSLSEIPKEILLLLPAGMFLGFLISFKIKFLFFLSLIMMPFQQYGFKISRFHASPSNIILILLLLGLTIRFLTKDDYIKNTIGSIKKHPLSKYLILSIASLFVAYLLSTLFSINANVSFKYLPTVISSIIFFFLPLLIIKNYSTLKRAFVFYLAGALLVAIFEIAAALLIYKGVLTQGYINNIFSIWIGTSRTFAGFKIPLKRLVIFFESHIMYGYFMLPAFAFCLSCFLNKSKRILKKIFLLLSSLIILLSFLVVQSRGLILGIFIIGIVVFLIKLRKEKNFYLRAMAVISMIFSALVVLAGVVYSFYSVGLSGIIYRIYQLKWALSLFLKHPLFGIGWGNVESLKFPAYLTKILPAHHVIHNMFLQLLITTGILGFLSIIGIFTFSFLMIIKTKLPPGKEIYKTIFISSFLVIFFLSFVDTIIWSRPFFFYLGLLTSWHLIKE